MNILNSYTPGSKRFQKELSKRYCKTYKNNSLIFLLRHGQIKGHKIKRFIGQTDVPLDHTGIKQAILWQKSFVSIKFNTVYSSSMQRCLNTAQLASPQSHININPELNEINMGEWDGKSFSKIKKEKPGEFKKRGENIYKFQPAKGESFQDLSNRVLPFFKRLKTKLLQLNTRDNKILIVTHAGVIRVLVCHILGMNPEDLFETKLNYGHLSVLKIKHTV